MLDDFLGDLCVPPLGQQGAKQVSRGMLDELGIALDVVRTQIRVEFFQERVAIQVDARLVQPAEQYRVALRTNFIPVAVKIDQRTAQVKKDSLQLPLSCCLCCRGWIDAAWRQINILAWDRCGYIMADLPDSAAGWR